MDGDQSEHHSPDVIWSTDDPPSVASATENEQDLRHHLQSLQAHRLSVAQGQEELLAVEEIRDKIKLLDHQLEAAHRALFQMGSGALFADEVGLGKTIEVGMVLKEMDFRDTHDSFLVLTPAQLAPQWQEELSSKFELDFVCNYDDEFEGFDAHDRIVASVDTAKGKRHKEDVLDRRWDVLVLDEAHSIRNTNTQRYQLIDEIEYESAYFATATPIQNDITDLYNIIDLIRPGLLGTREEFNDRYVADAETAQIKNSANLQKKLDRVMIRNRREETDIDFTNRRVRTQAFEPSAAERDLYVAVTQFVRSSYSKQDAKHLVMLLLQKEVVSSPAAVSATVDKWISGDGSASFDADEMSLLRSIKEMAEEITKTTKLERLGDVVETARDQLDTAQLVTFTQFKPTQQQIAENFDAVDIPVHVVNGDLSSQGKEEVIADFREEGGLLVATDSISEGRNLQFCNVMVNYDLPWNPMSVEQRIGRIDRIGQDREVHVFNLALEDTVEEHVLDKLYGKIDLFTQSIGGIRDILSRMENSGKEFETEVFERLRTADTQVELENNFEKMAVDLEDNKEAAERMEDFNRGVFEGFEFGGGEA